MAGLPHKRHTYEEGSLDQYLRDISVFPLITREQEVELAKKILLMDDEVDRRKNDVFKQMTAFVRNNPQHVETALDLILIARNLERLGDHATNIAEDVIFVSTGKDVRHGGKFS